MVNKKEVQEARTVAYEVVQLLNQVEKQLKSARNWGIYDMLGGEFFSSLIKHNKINKAEDLLQKVRSKLVELQRELGDVQLGLEPTLTLSGFDRFMDIVFDNIISDWMVQSKIAKSLQDVSRVKDEVERVIVTLNQIEKEYGL